MHLYCSEGEKNISGRAGKRALTPSSLLAVIILAACKQTLWVVRGPMRLGEEEEMRGKLDEEEKLGNKGWTG